MQFISPVSGATGYIFNEGLCVCGIVLLFPAMYEKHVFSTAESQRWINEHDQHDMEGLIVRDLIRCCGAIPDSM
jgi:hypothetical protein